MVTLQYDGEIELNNTKGIFLKGKLVGNYGTNLIGDLMNLNPTQNNGVDGGITDPNAAYNLILQQPTAKIFPIGADLGGSYLQVTPNAKPTLSNAGLRVYLPGGTEKATGAAYLAAELAGTFELLVMIPTATQ